MDCDVSVPVGIVVSRETVDHPWEEIRWRSVGVLLDPPAKAQWREVARGRGYAHYHAATLSLTLTRKCAMNYRVNLANGVPSVYLVIRQRPGAGADVPIEVCRVSASPFEIDAQSLDTSEHIERVPMPAELVALVQSFVDAPSPNELSEPRGASGRQRREARDDKFGFGLDLGGFGQLSPGK